MDVADRGADLTEYLAYEHRANRSHMTRSAHNRAVEIVEADGRVVKTKLHDQARRWPVMSQKPRKIQVSGGWGSQSVVVSGLG